MGTRKITGYRISKETNAREMPITPWLKDAKVKNISFETALREADWFATKIIKNSKINLFQLKPEAPLWFFSMP